MDPLATINPKKDSTVAMMEAAQDRGHELFCLEQSGLLVRSGKILVRASRVKVTGEMPDWCEVLEEVAVPAEHFDAIFMRKDPPFDMEYVYSTYLLEMVERCGTPVLNRPGSIRDCNEKLFALDFPACVPPYVVSRDPGELRAFHDEHRDVVYKPLYGMGGASIFRAAPGEHNLSVIIETLTEHGGTTIMAQKYLPEIAEGDTRILLINGEPVPYGLARIPATGETRGNLAAGGSGVGRELTERDLFICAEVGPRLREKGLHFVGIDVIGDYLTEVNVTCPTCVRELNAAFGLDIAGDYINFVSNFIEDQLRQGKAAGAEADG